MKARNMRKHIVIGAAAIVFGALTVLSGGTVLFGPQAAREIAGDIVYPVLWFNVLSGVAYVVAGGGILLRRAWARPLSWAIAVAIAAMIVVLVGLILTGAPFEPRTLVAMGIRLVFWIAVARSLQKGAVA
ncbi:hypothetical protein R3X27_10020 [Tropicimonas sp. TH_r6]|uniref:hypothetical protein n=1 Tax=Tropicimonas sp. TH_r6 TaxID=3082085 RepID=UPI002953D197|nr:hypothetical protein [Tropicimonas sp. TH_r6]MDV7143022.1 hypothetical protein [Tropicimonas sp. TH_r6]